MTLTLRLLAILGLFALSTLPFVMAADDDQDETVIVDGDGGSPDGGAPEDEDN